MAEPEWKEFERAVASFVSALDPKAKVRHNAKLPDRDTGRPRQRDVWVETKIGDHFPVTILVSCKRTKDRVDQQDVDAFIGELRSSGANKGVIYSYSGFTTPAVEKASALDVSCCRLYVNQPPDIPEVLTFRAYCCKAKVRLNIYGNAVESGATVDDLFDLPRNNPEGTFTLLSDLLKLFHEREKRAVADKPEGEFPKGWQVVFEINAPEVYPAIVQLVVDGGWNIFEAELKAYLIDGSYCFTSKDFKGSQETPWMNTKAEHPGPGWELVKEPGRPAMKAITALFYKGDVESALRKVYGGAKISQLILPSIFSSGADRNTKS